VPTPTPLEKVTDEGAQVLTNTSLNEGFAWAGLLGGNAVYRAVEFGIPAVSYRAWGGSFIVGPHGRIVEDQAPEAEIVAGVIPPTHHETFYGRYGDIFSYVILLLMAGLVGYNIYLARKSSFRYCKECGTQLPKTRQLCEQCQSSEKPTLWRRILSLIGP